MSERVTMPALGESVTEGTVTRWLKNVGDQVEVDEPLLEVSTDKVDTEIPSPVAGMLQEILAEEDETVDVGADLAVIGDGDAPSGGDAAPAEEPRSDDSADAAPRRRGQHRRDRRRRRRRPARTRTPCRRPATRAARSRPSPTPTRRRAAPAESAPAAPPRVAAAAVAAARP